MAALFFATPAAAVSAASGHPHPTNAVPCPLYCKCARLHALRLRWRLVRPLPPASTNSMLHPARCIYICVWLHLPLAGGAG